MLAGTTPKKKKTCKNLNSDSNINIIARLAFTKCIINSCFEFQTTVNKV